MFLIRGSFVGLVIYGDGDGYLLYVAVSGPQDINENMTTYPDICVHYYA